MQSQSVDSGHGQLPRVTWRLEGEDWLLEITVSSFQSVGTDPLTNPFRKVVRMHRDTTGAGLDLGTLVVENEMHPSQLQKVGHGSEEYSRRGDSDSVCLKAQQGEQNRVYVDMTSLAGPVGEAILAWMERSEVGETDPLLLTVTASERELGSHSANITFSYLFLSQNPSHATLLSDEEPEDVVLLWTDSVLGTQGPYEVVPWSEMRPSPTMPGQTWLRDHGPQSHARGHSRAVSAMSVPSLASILSPRTEGLRTPEEGEMPDVHFLPDGAVFD